MASRNAEKGEKAKSDIQGSGGIQGQLSTIQLDVTDPKSIETAVKHIDSKFGKLDVLVNNAGIASKDTNLKSQLEATLGTNVIGAAMVSQSCKPLLTKSKNGYLLHISSGLGSLGLASNPEAANYNATYTVYRMSKAALNMLALQDFKELAPKNVKVFAVCPGLVVSNLRGTSEEERSAGGRAIDPKISGDLILDIITGKRDADVGKFVRTGGLWPW